MLRQFVQTCGLGQGQQLAAACVSSLHHQVMSELAGGQARPARQAIPPSPCWRAPRARATADIDWL